MSEESKEPKKIYHCVVCGRGIECDEYGIFCHDDVPHPENMDFSEESNPQ